MLAITVLQRFLSIILAPTPFADLFLSASSSFVAPLRALVVTSTLTGTPLIPTVTDAVVDVKEDSRETLVVVTDMYETSTSLPRFPLLTYLQFSLFLSLPILESLPSSYRPAKKSLKT